MKSAKTHACILGCLCAVLGVLSGGTKASQVLAQSEPATSVPQIKQIVVVPFLKGRRGYRTKETIDSPVAELYIDPVSVSGDSDRILTGYVQKTLEGIYGDRVIPFERAIRAYEGIVKERSVDTPRALAQKTGTALGATVAMGGNVWRYRLRVGGAAGVETPAAVGFFVYLIDVASGKVLWDGSFEETQKSLSENVLEARKFFERGAKWLTADELARFGVKEIFKKYPF